MMRERGAAALLAVVTVGIVSWLGLLTIQFAGAVGDRIALETGADAAALAAVGAASVGDHPVEAASQLAELNGVTLVQCVCASSGSRALVATVRVATEIHVPGLGVRRIEATATAEYAGPQS